MTTLSAHIQNPHKAAKLVRTDALFTTKSGHQLKMREVAILADGSKLQVPQHISRQVFPDVPGYLNGTKWIVTIGPVDFYVRDDEMPAAVSLIKACRILYENYGKPIAVLKALKTSSKMERRRKNILTGVPGMQCKSKLDGGRLAYSFVLSNALPRKAFIPGINFDPFATESVQHAYNHMLTLRTLIQRERLTTPEEVSAMHKTLRSQPALIQVHKMPADLVKQIKDNYVMRMAVKKGSGVKNTITGKLIKG